MTVRRNRISLNEVSKLLRYDPITGLFYWITKRNGTTTKNSAGHAGKYIRIKIAGKMYSASCLAWLFMTGVWPEHEVDHADLDKHNNRWNNLRAATRQQNTRNVPKREGKSSSYKGVWWHAWSGKWESKICYGGRQNSLGRFDTEEEAYAAYCAAAKKHHGEFARTS